MRVRLAFHGPMTAAQRAKRDDAVGRRPVHTRMTATGVPIETAPR